MQAALRQAEGRLNEVKLVTDMHEQHAKAAGNEIAGLKKHIDTLMVRAMSANRHHV